MKQYIVVLLIMIGSFLNAQNLGIGLSIIPEGGQFGFQARGAYNATEKVSISGAFNYFLKKGNKYGIDLDAQFKILSISDVKISPFAGINIGQRSEKLNTGLQLGLFIEIPRDGVDLYIEPKAILDENTVIAIAGGFYF